MEFAMYKIVYILNRAEMDECAYIKAYSREDAVGRFVLRTLRFKRRYYRIIDCYEISEDDLI